MHFKSVILFTIIIFVVHDAQSFLIWGLNTNISAIYQSIFVKGDNQSLNKDPDWIIGRKNLNDPVVLTIVKNDDLSKNTEEELKVRVKNIKEEEHKKPDRRKTNAELVKKQHDKKLEVIIDFLDNHYLSTNYFYDEVKRILRQRKVKDDLRRMVEYLEKPDKVKMKEQVLKCYYDRRISETHVDTSLDRFKTNNLVINVVKDPYNDGFIN